jgi:outer membrane protein OmpU
MGVVYNGNDVNFDARARVQFDLSAESDNGLSFGASFRADNAAGAAGKQNMNAGTIWVSGGFGKFAMGDVVSAGEAALGDLSGVGYTGLNDYSDIPYINGDGVQLGQGTGALYSYASGAFGVHVGLFDGDDSVGSAGLDSGYSVGVSYGTDTYSLALAYLNNGAVGGVDGAEEIIIGGSGTFGATTVKAYYADFDNAGFDKSYGLSLDYGMDATTLTAFARRDEAGAADFDSFGLGVAYDLGGGAALKAGIVDSDYEADTIADLGITMKF